jgi:hypothetical protein
MVIHVLPSLTFRPEFRPDIVGRIQALDAETSQVSFPGDRPLYLSAIPGQVTGV